MSKSDNPVIPNSSNLFFILNAGTEKVNIIKDQMEQIVKLLNKSLTYKPGSKDEIDIKLVFRKIDDVDRISVKLAKASNRILKGFSSFKNIISIFSQILKSTFVEKNTKGQLKKLSKYISRFGIEIFNSISNLLLMLSKTNNIIKYNNIIGNPVKFIKNINSDNPVPSNDKSMLDSFMNIILALSKVSEIKLRFKGRGFRRKMKKLVDLLVSVSRYIQVNSIFIFGLAAHTKALKSGISNLIDTVNFINENMSFVEGIKAKIRIHRMVKIYKYILYKFTSVSKTFDEIGLNTIIKSALIIGFLPKILKIVVKNNLEILKVIGEVSGKLGIKSKLIIRRIFSIVKFLIKRITNLNKFIIKKTNGNIGVLIKNIISAVIVIKSLTLIVDSIAVISKKLSSISNTAFKAIKGSYVIFFLTKRLLKSIFSIINVVKEYVKSSGGVLNLIGNILILSLINKVIVKYLNSAKSVFKNVKYFSKDFVKSNMGIIAFKNVFIKLFVILVNINKLTGNILGFSLKIILLRYVTKLIHSLVVSFKSTFNEIKEYSNGFLKSIIGVKVFTHVLNKLIKCIYNLTNIKGKSGLSILGTVFLNTIFLTKINSLLYKFINSSIPIFTLLGLFFKFKLRAFFGSFLLTSTVKSFIKMIFKISDAVDEGGKNSKGGFLNLIKNIGELTILSFFLSKFIDYTMNFINNFKNISFISVILSSRKIKKVFSLYTVLINSTSELNEVLKDKNTTILKVLKSVLLLKIISIPFISLLKTFKIIVEHLSKIGLSLKARFGVKTLSKILFSENGIITKLSEVKIDFSIIKTTLLISLALNSYYKICTSLILLSNNLVHIDKNKKRILGGITVIGSLIESLGDMIDTFSRSNLAVLGLKTLLKINTILLLLISAALTIRILSFIISPITVVKMWILRHSVSNLVKTLNLLSENSKSITTSRRVTVLITDIMNDIIPIFEKVNKLDIQILLMSLFEIYVISFIYLIKKINKSAKEIKNAKDISLDLSVIITNLINSFEPINKININDVLTLMFIPSIIRKFSNTIKSIGKDKKGFSAGIKMCDQLIDLLVKLLSNISKTGDMKSINPLKITLLIAIINPLKRIVISAGKKSKEIKKGIPITKNLIELLVDLFKIVNTMNAGLTIKAAIANIIAVSGTLTVCISQILLINKFKRKISGATKPIAVINMYIQSISTLVEAINKVEANKAIKSTGLITILLVQLVGTMKITGNTNVMVSTVKGSNTILKLSLIMPILALSFLATSYIMSKVNFKIILSTLLLVVGVLGIFIGIAYLSKSILPYVQAISIVVAVLAGAFLLFALSFYVVALTIEKIASIEIDKEKTKETVSGIVECLKIIIKGLGNPLLLFGTAFAFGTLMLSNVLLLNVIVIGKLISRFNKTGPTKDDLTTFKTNVNLMISSILNLLEDNKENLFDVITGRLKRKFRKLRKIVKSIGMIGKTISDFANLKIETEWNSKGDATGYRTMDKSDFETATANMKLCISSLLALFSKTDASGNLTGEESEYSIILNDIVDNKLKRRVRQFGKIVKFISKIGKTVTDFANLKIETEWNENGDPTNYRTMDKSDFETATANMKLCFSNLLSLFCKTDSNGNLTGEESEYSIILDDIVDNKLKRRVRQFGKIVKFIGRIGKTVTDFAQMKYATEWNDEGVAINYQRMGKPEFTAAATNIKTCVDAILDIFDDGKSNGVISGFLSKKVLEYKLKKSVESMELLSKIISPVSTIANVVIKMASSQIPDEWNDAGVPIHYRDLNETDYTKATENVKKIIDTLIGEGGALNTISSVLNTAKAKWNILDNGKSSIMDDFVKVVEPITKIVDCIIKLASASVPKAWDESGNPTAYMSIFGDGNENPALKACDIINTLVVDLISNLLSDDIEKKLKDFKKKNAEKMAIVTSSFGPIGTMVTAITNIARGTMKQYKDGKEVGTISIHEFLSSKDKTKELVSSIINIFEEITNQLGGTLDETKTQILTDAGVKIGKYSAVIDPLKKTFDKLTAISSKAMATKLDESSGKKVSAFIDSLLSGKVFTAQETTSIENKIRLLGNLSVELKKVVDASISGDKLKVSLEATEKFITKINNADSSKLEKMVSITKNLSEFSKSINGNFNKLADTINEKLVEALEKVDETIKELNGTIENKKFGPNTPQVVQLPQKMQTLNGKNEVPVAVNAKSKAAESKLNKIKNKPSGNGDLKDCIVPTSDGGMAIAVVHKYE